ncbi:hypothetical protein CU044_0385 [Streptomyces sp. L-9-10]|nr:hypothetical protein CU044_0385 [Streptomyces sp. L-9-10]
MSSVTASGWLITMEQEASETSCGRKPGPDRSIRPRRMT